MATIVRFDECCTAIPSDIVTMLRSLKNELLKIDDIISVILFGSYSKGTYNKNSDIDIAVFVCDPAVNRMLSVYKQAVHCAAEYQYDIQILIFTAGSLTYPMGIVDEIVTYGKDITFI